MILLQDVALSSEMQKELDAWQALVDVHATHRERVEQAESLWRQKSRVVAFERVKALLKGMCPPQGRCMYCEDDSAYQVDHFRPKSLYPRLVFAWHNYLFACSRCNNSKMNRFAIFEAGGMVVEQRVGGEEPRDGDAVLLNPRCDDPMDYMRLDLRGSFLFMATQPRGTTAHARAEKTIEWLRLNRDDLGAMRALAYDDYRSRLEKYVQDKLRGAGSQTIEERKQNIRRRGHVTVWREMQRQHERMPELREFFTVAPEALTF